MGDCAGGIHVWDPDAAAGAAAMGGGDCSGVWRAGTAAGYSSGGGGGSGRAGGGGGGGGGASVEDLQWSPNEATVFASASADGAVRIWDTRVRERPMLGVGGPCDVNVLSWSRLVAYLLASGAEDGSFSIWDLRAFKSGGAVAHFAWHTGQLTGIEWAPDDENVLAVCSADGTTTLWDMSLEEDEEAELAMGGAQAAGKPQQRLTPSTQDAGLKEIPLQLLFLHAG